MRSIFRPGDRLVLEPVHLAEVRSGDVVAFRSSNGQRGAVEIVHRVVAVRPEGLVTRGDNNRETDQRYVTEETLLGRVNHVERDGVVRDVHGGRRGLLRARLLRMRLAVWRSIKAVGRKPYRWLRASGLISRWWQPAVHKVWVSTENGLVVKYVSAGRTVAKWWPEQKRFACRKPYDLVIPRPDGP
jgi:hypothetical protein